MSLYRGGADSAVTRTAHVAVSRWPTYDITSKFSLRKAALRSQRALGKLMSDRPFAASLESMLGQGNLLDIVSVQRYGIFVPVKEDSNTTVVPAAADKHTLPFREPRATHCSKLAHPDPCPCHRRLALGGCRVSLFKGRRQDLEGEGPAAFRASLVHAQRWYDEK